ncbi:tRNA pseudouridine(38-40) synthase TruA [Bacillaceae bacterium SIJ1]|uniref:tRNA pseudouridine(38-40) synthase TruA n=1 Tax=Litoribacterium kuwaitense TaxID=1398745 RepID=UPI0013ED82D6|nr:tRNA pseudouridine(38-40) synthase TruA [Litoribacterium kuwaitense]NGP45872.1 tRNA pseudouridine(38-40) synthase TruA [Litoribacterium kuwaitense]
MPRWRGIIQYDGSKFSGFQRQSKGRTVQGVVEKALGKMHKTADVPIFGSGRTDAGVHAFGQVIHFDSPVQIPEERWLQALNGWLPDDVILYAIAPVEETFHARYDAIGKAYEYRVTNGPIKDVFRRLYVHHEFRPLNEELMQEALALFYGTHDFRAFCSTRSTVTSHVRTVTKATLEKSGAEFCFYIEGNGFLHHMVRMIVGTVIKAGHGAIAPEDIQHCLESGDKGNTVKTAPAQGLYLLRVDYPEDTAAKEN